MAILVKRSRDIVADGIKVLVYGESGSGKTTLTPTMPAPIVLSAEGGLLSIRGADVPYIEITSMEDLKEAYVWLLDSAEAKAYQSVCLDSISEVAEVVLGSELSKKGPDGKKVDGRAAYGETGSVMGSLIRAFRDLPGRHVYMSAKLDKTQDEMGRILYGPSMPGKTLTKQLPYFFDFVFAMRAEKDADGETQRALQTDGDGLWLAKSRSSALETWEAPDLGEIIKKIGGE